MHLPCLLRIVRRNSVITLSISVLVNSGVCESAALDDDAREDGSGVVAMMGAELY